MGKKIFAAWTALGLAIVTAAYLFTYQEKLRLNLSKIALSQEKLSLVYDLQSHLCGAEVCTRSYVETGEAGQWQTYQNSVQEIQRIFTRLHRLAGDNPEQQARLGDLKSLVDQRLAFFQKSLELRRQKGATSPEHQVLAQKGMVLRDKIWKILEGLEKAEKTLQDQWLGEEETKARIWFWALTLGTFLSFTLLLLILYFLNREMAERKRAEMALRESEARFRNLLEYIPGVSIQGYSPDGTVRYWNKASEEVYGYTAQEAVGKNLADLIIPEDLKWHFGQALELGAQAHKSGEFQPPGELMLKHKKGSLVPVYSIHTVVCLDGHENLMFCIDVDLSEQKKAEEALKKAHDELEHRVEERTAALQQSAEKLRSLTSQMLTAQERERQRISRELHDEMGQTLLVLKLRLSALHDGLREDQQDLARDLKQSLDYLDGVIDSVRRLSRDLSPSILEELGLTSALRYLTSEFGKHYQVKSIEYDSDDIDALFPPRTQINIYRIFQECLTNIGKHAEASHISVAVKKKDGGVSFLVADNGKGFAVEDALSRPAAERGLGLATIYERVRILGGALQIWSQPGGGTLISFIVPGQKG